jgi:putative oxidoreductase
VNTGLLVLRLIFGLLLVGHGSQKLFGLFGGPGLDGAGGFFQNLGFRPGKPMAIVAGTSEAGAGLLLVLGLLTPLASAAVIGTLVVAGSVHWAAGLWAQNGGFEMPLLYVTAAAALAREEDVRAHLTRHQTASSGPRARCLTRGPPRVPAGGRFPTCRPLVGHPVCEEVIPELET